MTPRAQQPFIIASSRKLKRRARGLVGGGNQLVNSIKASDYENLDLLPADFDHRNLDIIFDQQKRSKKRLDIALRQFQREYDLIILDCPPTINIVAENIFNASDRLLVPLIPTTLSVRTHEQLMSFLAAEGRSTKRVSAFFSMVDARRNLHRQIMASLQAEFDGILHSSIPYLSQIEQMGIYREPVPVFAPRSKAASSYQDLWMEIQGVLMA